MDDLRTLVPWLSSTITLLNLWLRDVIVAIAAIENRCRALHSADSRYLPHRSLPALLPPAHLLLALLLPALLLPAVAGGVEPQLTVESDGTQLSPPTDAATRKIGAPDYTKLTGYVGSSSLPTQEPKVIWKFCLPTQPRTVAAFSLRLARTTTNWANVR